MTHATPPPVFLHIGTMKTGTTFLQKLLIENKERLAASGYLFPGASWKSQIRAAQEIARATPRDPVLKAEAHGAWEALVKEMAAHSGAASIVSMEFLSHAGPGEARAAVASLAPAEVHVVLTVRDATAIIPAQWQTSVRSGHTETWQDFRTGVRRADGLRGRLGRFSDPTAARFRRFHDVARMLEAWGAQVPAERLHVVTVPATAADPRVLWERFAGVIGLDPELCPSSPRANESLGYPSTELLRRVNAALGAVPPSDYNVTVREHLAGRVLAPASGAEARPLLDSATYEFGLQWNRRTRRALDASGARLVGDLEDLPTTSTERHRGLVDDTQAPPAEDELSASAAVALEGMRALVERRTRRALERGVRAGDLPRDAAAGTASPAEDPVTAAVTEIAELCGTAMELRRRIKA
jgi:hypothetical protein